MGYPVRIRRFLTCFRIEIFCYSKNPCPQKCKMKGTSKDSNRGPPWYRSCIIRMNQIVVVVHIGPLHGNGPGLLLHFDSIPGIRTCTGPARCHILLMCGTGMMALRTAQHMPHWVPLSVCFSGQTAAARLRLTSDGDGYKPRKYHGHTIAVSTPKVVRCNSVPSRPFRTHGQCNQAHCLTAVHDIVALLCLCDTLPEC